MRAELRRFKATGQLSHRQISITDTRTSATISEDKEEMRIQNVGGSTIYVGGPDVTATNYGVILTPRMSMIFSDCPPDFKIYFICGTGESSTIGVIER